MPTIKETTVYKFSELPENIQEKVIQDNYDINVDFDQWHEGVYDDCIEMGKVIGIDVTKIYFTGFSSQGDGACFEGSYEYKKGSCKEIRNTAPVDTKLHAIADNLYKLQKRHFFDLSANVKHRGHYYHSMCTDIDVSDNREYAPYNMNVDTENDMMEYLRDFMEWMYRQFEKEYEYQTTENAIKETIEANEYDFTINGKMY